MTSCPGTPAEEYIHSRRLLVSSWQRSETKSSVIYISNSKWSAIWGFLLVASIQIYFFRKGRHFILHREGTKLPRPVGPRMGVGFLRRGQRAPPHQLWPGERSSPSGSGAQPRKIGNLVAPLESSEVTTEMPYNVIDVPLTTNCTKRLKLWGGEKTLSDSPRYCLWEDVDRPSGSTYSIWSIWPLGFHII